MRKFTPEEDQFLRDNYLTIPAKRMAKMLGRTEGTARQRMNILKLKVPDDIIKTFKNIGRFKPGSIPFNTGKKIHEFMSAEAIEKSTATRFKKGNKPHNTKTDNHISVRKDKRGITYQWIRISEKNWVPLHVFNWEQKNGRVPKGYNIVFKDHNTMNADISNLEILSNAELLTRNSIYNYPAEIVQVMKLKGALKRKLNSKKLANEKQHN